MRPLHYTVPTSIEAAVSQLAASPAARVLAGGTDLLPLMRRGIEAPEHLISLKGISELDDLRRSGDGSWLIGSRVRLSRLTGEATMGGAYPILAQAAQRVATPQIRNVATVGGNLCQRPRCYYFRHPDFTCARRGGEGCPAMGGQNRYHAIFDSHGCAIVHPSDLAPTLMALNAEAVLAGSEGERRLPLGDFFVGPETSPRSETCLKAGEILVAIRVPPPATDSRGVFLKVSERRVSDFALASIAVVVTVGDGGLAGARVVLGGVAPTPQRRRDLEQIIVEGGMAPDTVERVTALAIAPARPLAHNGYKAKLVASLVRRSLTQLM